jgi:hypothetical protein
MTRPVSIRNWINSRRYEMYYKNGREAKVGDIAVGPTYNRKGTQIGVITSITPGTETCNCHLTTSFDFLVVGYNNAVVLAPKKLDASNGYDYDYSELKNLLHIEDYIKRLTTHSNNRRSSSTIYTLSI